MTPGRLSLRWRVPGIIALILSGAMVLLSVLAYRAARESAVDAAHERLQSAVSRVAALATAGVGNLLRGAATVAGDTAVVLALRTPGQPLTAGARAALARLRTDTTQRIEIALLDTAGRPVEGVTPELVRERLEPAPAPVSAPTITPFRNNAGTLEYIIAAPVKDSGRVIGQLVQWRRITRVTTGVRLISDLIGDSASLLIGNADGTLVTELRDTLRPPQIRDSVQARHARETRTMVSAAVPGTPWAFSLEYPYSIIVRPLRVLTVQSAIVAALVLVLAVVAGEILSRGMTRSLTDLTTTAERIAGGDLTPRPKPVHRADEIGRLARSFHTMAESIRDSRTQLEHRIATRTADLQSALTRLRETQDELVRKEKLAILGQLSSSIGHELRNPLGVMSNAVYILERTIHDPTPQVEEYLRLLKGQIKLSERIVADLLDSVRSQSPQRRAVPVDALLSDQLRRIAVPETVRVDLSVEEDLHQLHVDPDQVGQILVNLFTNAVQAMSDKPGTLTVRASDGNGRVRIEVRDTGPGVPAAMTEKIFEPLYTTKARGIGLGLAVSRSLAVANSGSLSVVNHPDGGAVFVLDLPAGET